MILIIESSADYPSVALADRSGRIVWEKICSERQSHSEKLPLFVHEALNFLDDQNYMVCTNIGPLSAVAISQGPGSYTGLRIGTSLAKGLCYSKDVPLISVDGFWGMGNWMLKEIPAIQTVFSMLDARRDEVYIQRINRGETPGQKGYELNELGNEIPRVEARILNEETLQWMGVEYWSEVGFIGNANEKAIRILNEFQLVQPGGLISEAPNANMFGEEAAYKMNAGLFENVAYFEPYYLKDFVPGVSTKFKI